MNGQTRWLLFLMVILLFSLLLTGCGQQEAQAGLATATPEAPAGVVMAREAALDFLREGANECVPPKITRWQVNATRLDPPAGFAAYRFTAEQCLLTVAYSTEEVEQAYHVTIGDGQTRFCWQAVIGESGQIVRAGSAAATEPGPGNPAATYCQEQGYEYELMTQENGTLCGACSFPDGSMCRAWDFFYGECAAGEQLPAGG